MVAQRSIRDGEPTRDSFRADAIRDKVQDTVRDRVQDTVRDTVRDSVRDRVQDTVRDSVRDNVRDRISDSIRDTIQDSKWDSGKRSFPTSRKISQAMDLPPMLEKAKVQKGLIPIGNNIYVTPGGPVQPSDCNRWPNSPMCGGQFFDTKLFNQQIGIIADECNLGVNIRGTAGGWSLPNFQAVYRKQECIDFKPAEELPDLVTGTGTKLKLPELDPNTKYLIAIEVTSSDSDGTRYGKVKELNCSQVAFGMGQIEQNFRAFSIYANQPYPYRTHPLNNALPSLPSYIDIYPPSVIFANDAPPLGRIMGLRDAPVSLFSGRGDLLKMYFEEGIKQNTWDFSNDERNSRARLSIPPVFWEMFYGGGPKNFVLTQKIERIVDLETCKKVFPIEVLPPPPPPPERCECDDMGCCPQPANNNEQLLKLILQRIGPFPTNVQIYDSNENQQEAQQQTRRVSDISEAFRVSVERTEKASKMIGIDDFPITVPKTLMEKPPEDGILGAVWDFITPDETKTINNLTELSVWQTEQIYDALGSWTQTVVIKDSDATEEGDQTKKLVLPNIAETLKEIIIILMQLAKIQGLQLDIDLKTLLETSSTKLAATKAALVATDIQQYLDYETTERCADVEVQVTVPNIIQPDDPGSGASDAERRAFEEAKDNADKDANDLIKFLRSSTAKVKYDDWDGKHSMQDQLTDLDNAAAMIRAQFFQTE